jgi:hypothetical protein
LIDLLSKAGYTVEYSPQEPAGGFRLMRADPPYAAIIDMTRLPAHGYYVATAVRGSKTLRHIPIVFVDGTDEKLERVRRELPDATFTTRARLAGVLKKARPLTEPAAAPDYMNRFAGRSAAQKLGIKEGAQVAVVDPPADYLQVIGELPTGVAFEESPRQYPALTLWFVRELDVYLEGLRRMRDGAGKTRLWVIYPKLQAKARGAKSKADAGLNQNRIREAALAVGLVDYKICSVNETWSGMLFTRKK